MNAAQRTKFWLYYKIKPNDKVKFLGETYELIDKREIARLLIIRRSGGTPANIDMSFVDPDNLITDDEI